MNNEQIISEYFTALSTHNGRLAASLFTEAGAIDDFRGRHHAGQAAITAFIDQVPELKLEFQSELVTESARITAYGYIHYPGKESPLVRWIFSMNNGKIAHLCNSRIEVVPEECLKKHK